MRTHAADESFGVPIVEKFLEFMYSLPVDINSASIAKTMSLFTSIRLDLQTLGTILRTEQASDPDYNSNLWIFTGLQTQFNTFASFYPATSNKWTWQANFLAVPQAQSPSMSASASTMTLSSQHSDGSTIQGTPLSPSPSSATISSGSTASATSSQILSAPFGGCSSAANCASTIICPSGQAVE